MSASKKSVSFEAIYEHRFSDREKAAMARVWRVLIDDVFAQWISKDDSVLDVGSGLGNFINQVDAQRRVAIDANPASKKHCNSGVEFFQTSNLIDCDLGKPFDIAFVSNFLEHLDNPNEVLFFLSQIKNVLKPNGKIIVLQPNFALIGSRYFDFIDHKTILTDKSLVEALELVGFKVSYMKKRFLPYTSKSALPKAPWMVRLYLRIPFAQYLLAGQSLAVGICEPSPRD